MMYGNMLSDSGLNVPLSSLATAESGDEALERENYEMLPGGTIISGMCIPPIECVLPSNFFIFKYFSP